jgi:DNA-directed RNA polymerase specialized sigma24 family protein
MTADRRSEGHDSCRANTVKRNANRPEIPALSGKRILRPTETALELQLIGRMDLLRLKAIARLYARGLPADVSWDDLLQEAFTRILVGTRQRPEGLRMIAFVAGVMLSLRTEHRRRVLRGLTEVREVRASEQERREIEPSDPAPGPERLLTVRQEIAAIHQLFANDTRALHILSGLGEGLTAEQIRTATGMSRTDYDATRKRMRRCLLREGLTTCEKK